MNVHVRGPAKNGGVPHDAGFLAALFFVSFFWANKRKKKGVLDAIARVMSPQKKYFTFPFHPIQPTVMKKFPIAIFAILTALHSFSQTNDINVIPIPVSVQPVKGNFTLTKTSFIEVKTNDADA